MALFLFLIIASFITTAVFIVPFINLLYRLKFLRQKQETHDFLGQNTPIFNKFHQKKKGTPLGGGILLVVVILTLFFLAYLTIKFKGYYISACFPIQKEIPLIIFTMVSFGLLGFFDDFKKIFYLKEKGVFGLRLRYKFAIQWILAFIIAFSLYFDLGIRIINIPFLGVFNIGPFYIPLAAFIIVAFTNAFNITDGLDGLANGILVFVLFAFCFLAFHIMDTPMTIFMAIWIGSLIAFLYFNVYPARIFLGDTGALSFGATMAVIGLLLGKIVALAFIGGLFIIEVSSSLLQMIAKKYWHKKIFPAAPFHLWLQEQGWEEPKIVARAWLAEIILVIVGLWLALV